MFCKDISKGREGQGSHHGFLSILRKIGVVAAPILMLTALLLLIWTMRKTYASLLNVKYLSNLITGRAFICRFQYPAYAIRYWYFLVTFFLAIALTFTTLARFLTHRKTRLAHFSFVIPTSRPLPVHARNFNHTFQLAHSIYKQYGLNL